MPVVVEGVEYDIDWTEFRIGSSFFIPCNNVKVTTKIIKGEIKRMKGVRCQMKAVVEDGIKGVRVWRVPLVPRRTRRRTSL